MKKLNITALVIGMAEYRKQLASAGKNKAGNCRKGSEGIW